MASRAPRVEVTGPYASRLQAARAGYNKLRTGGGKARVDVTGRGMQQGKRVGTMDSAVAKFKGMAKLRKAAKAAGGSVG